MMDQAIVPTADAIERVLNMLRARLESAMRNGQRVRMDAREGGNMRVHEKVIGRARVRDITPFSLDGRYELHIYIDRKR